MLKIIYSTWIYNTRRRYTRYLLKTTVKAIKKSKQSALSRIRPRLWNLKIKSTSSAVQTSWTNGRQEIEFTLKTKRNNESTFWFDLFGLFSICLLRVYSFCTLSQFSLPVSFSWQGLMKLFYLLWIRWPEDSVYLDQEALREEYVLNDSGLIWIGTARKHCGMPWNFGQVRVG